MLCVLNVRRVVSALFRTDGTNPPAVNGLVLGRAGGVEPDDVIHHTQAVEPPQGGPQRITGRVNTPTKMEYAQRENGRVNTPYAGPIGMSVSSSFSF